MARKEVFATTGTRLVVRVFGGFDFTAKDLKRSDFAKHGYGNGVPMAEDLKAAPKGKAPAVERLPGYAVGTLGAFCTIQRAAILLRGVA